MPVRGRHLAAIALAALGGPGATPAPWPEAVPAPGAPGVQVLGMIAREGGLEVSAWRIRVPGEDWQVRLPGEWALDQTTREIIALEPAAPDAAHLLP